MIPFKAKKLRPDAKLPTYAHPGDAGMDLFTPEAFDLQPSERKIVGLGFATEFPTGYMAEIRDKSGLSAKHGIHILGGIIDAGYRGEWMLALLNTGKDAHRFEAREKIAQAILTKIEQGSIAEVTELSEHKRGQGKHGSTGKF